MELKLTSYIGISTRIVSELFANNTQTYKNVLGTGCCRCLFRPIIYVRDIGRVGFLTYMVIFIREHSANLIKVSKV